MKNSQQNSKPAWCPGCGNFSILKTFNNAIDSMNLDRKKMVLVSGIGQAAKFPHYSAANVFNGLHGRALPAATGIKIANNNLKVIVTSGDGDMYGEGGNHFLHAIRRNIDVKAFVHNNQVYGLTKGQASPTSEKGFVTPAQPTGVIHEPINPLALAIVENCTFVARSFSGRQEHLQEMMQAAIAHEGFALLDILQPCVTFNKQNTFKWYNEKVKPIDDSHDPYNRQAALKLAFEWNDYIPIGIIYKNDRPAYHKQVHALQSNALVDSYEKSCSA